MKSQTTTDSAPPETFAKTFAGTINNKFEIEMKLQRQGDSLSGVYSYKSKGIEIPVKGMIAGNHLVLKEYGAKDSAQSGEFDGNFSSASEISGNWTNANGDKVMVFSLKEQVQTAPASIPATSNGSITVASTKPDNSVAQSAASSGLPGSSQPTVDKVQRAVDKAVDWTRKGGRVTVLGVQEISRDNAARADLRFDGFQYNANSYDLPISKDQKTPPEPDVRDPKYYEKMYQNRSGQVHVETYSGTGTAVLKHYNDGRWVLTGVQFGLQGVNATIEVK